MPPPPRRQIAPPLLLAAAAATSLAAVLAWAWYALPPPPAQDEPREDSARPKRKPSRSLTLATQLPPPPPAILDRIAAQYTLHLVLPAPPVPASSLPPYGPAFDPRRLVFHETPEGLVHVARVLGGTFVNVCPGISPICVPRDARDELDLDRLVKDLATFVDNIVVVGSGNKVAGRGVRTVQGWEELCVLLEV